VRELMTWTLLFGVAATGKMRRIGSRRLPALV
jgi:hypothetical protein